MSISSKEANAASAKILSLCAFVWNPVRVPVKLVFGVEYPVANAEEVQDIVPASTSIPLWVSVTTISIPSFWIVTVDGKSVFKTALDESTAFIAASISLTVNEERAFFGLSIT